MGGERDFQGVKEWAACYGSPFYDNNHNILIMNLLDYISSGKELDIDFP